MFERARRWRAILCSLVLLAFTPIPFSASGSASAEEPAAAPPAAAKFPTAAEVDDLLKREPMTLDNWPVWRKRILDWLPDPSSHTDRVFDAAEDFVAANLDAAGEPVPPLGADALAWYMLGRKRLIRDTPEAIQQSAEVAANCFRRSIAIDPTFARAHRTLGGMLLIQAPPGDAASPLAQEAERELKLAAELDPTLKMNSVRAHAAFVRKDFIRAEQLYQAAVAEEPESINHALALTACVLQNQQRTGRRSDVIAPLAARHHDDGRLACYYGVALVMDDKIPAAVAEFKRARALGVDPADVLNPDIVKSIEAAARPGPLQILLWVVIGFVVVYAVVMVSMALAGFILARWTRGAEALRLLGDQPLEVVSGGQVARTEGEPWLARLYAVCLVFGLILFYISLPFVTVGLLACTLGALWLILQAGRIPVKLVLLILFVGLAMTWAVLKSMFARSGSGSFGLKRTDQDAPRLFAALRDVASRVDTSPVDEVYIAPGSEIGVHQEGRGPWGIFGTKRRILTLGLSTLRTLTIPELKSILAHEYAHFSHRDTFYSRFIHRVDLSIHSALQGMGAAGGKLNYVNPFFWFLVLYYRAYSMLSAGFSRSREFLADRMACSLYGSNIFASALTKVSTEGPLFEATMYETVAALLAEEKALENMYEAFARFKEGTESQPHREKIQKDLSEERPSLFASHPTHRERLAAAESFPPGRDLDQTPAIELFENPEALEKELTEFLTGALHFVRQQAQAAAQSA